MNATKNEYEEALKLCHKNIELALSSLPFLYKAIEKISGLNSTNIASQFVDNIDTRLSNILIEIESISGIGHEEIENKKEHPVSKQKCSKRIRNSI